jgi:hypothetical protein
MLITFIALRSLWLVWREYQRRWLARTSLRQLTDMGATDADCEAELSPFWRAVQARYRKDASFTRARRARSRRALSRLSRMSERKLAAASAWGAPGARHEQPMRSRSGLVVDPPEQG